MGQIGLPGLAELIGNTADECDAIEFKALLVNAGYAVDLDGEPKITKDGEEIDGDAWESLITQYLQSIDGKKSFYQIGDCVDACTSLGYYKTTEEAAAAYGLQVNCVVEADSAFDAFIMNK